MRTTWIAAALCLALPRSLVAGVYTTAERMPGQAIVDMKGQPVRLELIQNEIEDQIKMRVDLLNNPGKDGASKSVQTFRQLEEKVQNGSATMNDKVNLSAYLIRLGKVDEAIRLLEPMSRDRAQNNFMVSANLGTAYAISRDWRAAHDNIQQALDLWPRQEWPGFTPEQLKWYRHAEEQQKKLIRLRWKEAGDRARPRQSESVDDLFGVKFIGPSGQYEAGTLAAAEKEKLPADALAVIAQLLFWMPDDGRLHWLLAETLNAQGNIKGAETVFNQCVGSVFRMKPPELREHRQGVMAAVAEAEAKAKADAEARAREQSASIWPDTSKLLVVGGAAALVIVFLVFLQVRELRRRRHAPS
jgi:tetratricopeptide (TPR) repeat protein